MGGTTKYAKDTKMGTQIIFKEESYKIVGRGWGTLVKYGHLRQDMAFIDYALNSKFSILTCFIPNSPIESDLA